ncbi:hypothetical protein [Metallibacterium sp.]
MKHGPSFKADGFAAAQLDDVGARELQRIPSFKADGFAAAQLQR